MIRKIKRHMLKQELGTNKISDEFHKRYGYKKNITKLELKLKERLLKAKRKSKHKKARKRKGENNE